MVTPSFFLPLRGRIGLVVDSSFKGEKVSGVQMLEVRGQVAMDHSIWAITYIHLANWTASFLGDET